MSTAVAAAAQTVTHDAGTAQASSSLYAEVMSLAPQIRREIVAGLGEKDLARLLRAARRDGGSMYALYRDDPVGFVEDVLGESLWSKPREILSAIPHHKRIAVPSCFGSSKTWSTSRTALWWATVHPPGTAQVVTIAPLWRQVVRLLWRELRHAHARSGLPGTADMAQLKLPDDMEGADAVVAYGIAANPYNESSVQGIHCFDDQTELLTDQGWKKFPQVTGNERVLTLNGDAAEWGPITEVWRHPFDGHLNLHDGERVNFAITDNHRLLVRGRAPGRPRFTAAQIAEIQARYRGDDVDSLPWSTSTRTEKGQFVLGGAVSQADLAAEFGVTQAMISRIIKGLVKPYQHVDGQGQSWELREFDTLPDEFIVRRTNRWGGGSNPETVEFSPPEGTPGTQHHFRFAFNDWAEFLGWFVAEGSVNITPQGFYKISISQKPGTKYEAIAALLDRMGVPYQRLKHDLRIHNKALGMWLREHCCHGSFNKRVPACIREATPEAMEAFLASYCDGDGAQHNGGRRYVTSSPLLADDVHEMLCKLGRGRKMRVMALEGSETVMSTTGRPFTRRHTVYLVGDPGQPTDSNVLRRNITKMRYKGTVYCVSTPHQTIMVRRKGCAMWSGNSPHLLLIVDEAGGIAPTVGKNFRALMTGDDSRMVAIGNPPSDNEGSWFEEFCNNDKVLTIPISAYDTPNFTSEVAPRCRSCPPNVPAHSLATHLVDEEWVTETIEEHGADAPFVTAKVHAKFPKGGSNRILPSGWVEAARDCPEPDGDDWTRLCDLDLASERAEWKVRRGAWIRLGVDVAADGGDEFVIARAIGDLGTVEYFASGAVNEKSMDVAGRILEEIRRAQLLAARLGTTARIRVKIDTIGVGWGVYGTLLAWGSEGIHDADIVKVDVREGTGRAADSELMKPYRKRDEMWIAFRKLIQTGRFGEPGAVRLRVDKKTGAQLSTPTYGTGSHSFTVIESKDSLKKRGMSSPDRGEAVLLAFYEPLVTEEIGRARLLVL